MNKKEKLQELVESGELCKHCQKTGYGEHSLDTHEINSCYGSDCAVVFEEWAEGKKV